jgi:DNA replication licensing factor MCM4
MEVTGIYRAQAMRVKATQKTLKSVYRTYIDVIHFKRTEKGRLGERGAESEMGEDSSLTKDREKAADRARKLAQVASLYFLVL